MSSNTPLVTASATAMAAAAGGPISEVFTELALMTAIMGGAGGLTLSLAVRGRGFKATGRSVALGGLLAAGFGAISPALAGQFMNIQIGNNVQALAAASFAIGMGQDIIAARITKWSGSDD